jgi:ABC-type dipeptide/oligopeptide/nickel transport system permease component
MPILRYIVRRCLFALALVLGVSALIFFLINAIGNPIDMLMADRPGITDQAIAALKSYYHLDRGVVVRYLIWLGSVARGDFGTSITYNQPVGPLLLSYGLEAAGEGRLIACHYPR